MKNLSGSERWGSRYWCIQGEGDPLYLMADSIEVADSGVLFAMGGHRARVEDEPEHLQVLYCLAKGQWHSFFAASMLDGSAVCEDQRDE